MDKVMDFLKRHVKATLVVAAFGIAVTLGFTAGGCEVDVAPAAVEAPAE